MKMKNIIYKGIIIALFIIFGFILGITTQSINASSNVNEIHNIQKVDYKYEIVYISGKKYIIFSNISGSDIEIVER